MPIVGNPNDLAGCTATRALSRGTLRELQRFRHDARIRESAFAGRPPIPSRCERAGAPRSGRPSSSTFTILLEFRDCWPISGIRSSPTGSSVVLARQGNNENLKEETATTWTAGIDFAPVASRDSQLLDVLRDRLRTSNRRSGRLRALARSCFRRISGAASSIAIRRTPTSMRSAIVRVFRALSTQCKSTPGCGDRRFPRAQSGSDRGARAGSASRSGS